MYVSVACYSVILFVLCRNTMVVLRMVRRVWGFGFIWGFGISFVLSRDTIVVLPCSLAQGFRVQGS